MALSRWINRATPMNRAAPLNRGLVSWFLAIPNAFHGPYWPDFAANRRGTLTNVPPATGWLGQHTQSQSWIGPSGLGGFYGCLDFDANNWHVVVPSMKFTGPPITVTAWASNLFNTGGYRTIYGDDAIHPTLLTSGAGATDKLGYQWEGSADEYNAASGLTLLLDTWQFYALTITSTAAVLYLSDAAGKISSYTNTKTHNSYSVVAGKIGADRAIAGHYWRGRISDVRIYNRALSSTEISALCRAGILGYPNELNWLRWPGRFAATGAAFLAPKPLIISQAVNHAANW